MLLKDLKRTCTFSWPCRHHKCAPDLLNRISIYKAIPPTVTGSMRMMEKSSTTPNDTLYNLP